MALAGEVTIEVHPAPSSAPESFQTLQLVLPWPITVNHYYADRVVIPKGWPKSGKRPFVQKYVTERGTDYHENTKILCALPTIQEWAKKNSGRPIAMRVQCFPPDAMRRDLGNLDKCLLDSLQYAGVVRDDYDIWDSRYQRVCLSQPPGRVVVRIKAINLGEISA